MPCFNVFFAAKELVITIRVNLKTPGFFGWGGRFFVSCGFRGGGSWFPANWTPKRIKVFCFGGGGLTVGLKFIGSS